jgi:hypothetical protein
LVVLVVMVVEVGVVLVEQFSDHSVVVLVVLV